VGQATTVSSVLRILHKTPHIAALPQRWSSEHKCTGHSGMHIGIACIMSMQAALAKEKSERARIVLSLRDTITGLKQAGDVEGRLKADLVQTHEDLAASRAAQANPHAVLCHAMAHVPPAVYCDGAPEA